MHYGFLCPPVMGHLNPMLALARAVRSLGHRCTFVTVADGEKRVREEGFDARLFALEVAPRGIVRTQLAQLARKSGLDALLYTGDLTRKAMGMLAQELPEALRCEAFDGLFIDQVSIGVESLAEAMGIPFVTVANALAQNADQGCPPWATDWDYDPTPWGAIRNQFGNFAGWALGLPLIAEVNAYRQKWGLAPRATLDALNSPLAQLSQLPEEFDFPRTELPAHHHYCGPFRSSPAASNQQVDFPFELLDGRPLIYASLGSVQNDQRSVFEKIAAACQGIDAQLVISLGGGLECHQVGQLPGNPLVVQYAPQLELLQQASLVITHAGLNTTLESLSNGVPMVAIPITNDQPGVAARIRYTGVGKSIPLSSLDPLTLRSAVREVLNEPSYSRNAARMRRACQEAGGAERAAQIAVLALSERCAIVDSARVRARADVPFVHAHPFI